MFEFFQPFLGSFVYPFLNFRKLCLGKSVSILSFWWALLIRNSDSLILGCFLELFNFLPPSFSLSSDSRFIIQIWTSLIAILFSCSCCCTYWNISSALHFQSYWVFHFMQGIFNFQELLFVLCLPAAPPPKHPFLWSLSDYWFLPSAV